MSPCVYANHTCKQSCAYACANAYPCFVRLNQPLLFLLLLLLALLLLPLLLLLLLMLLILLVLISLLLLPSVAVSVTFTVIFSVRVTFSVLVTFAVKKTICKDYLFFHLHWLMQLLPSQPVEKNTREWCDKKFSYYIQSLLILSYCGDTKAWHLCDWVFVAQLPRCCNRIPRQREIAFHSGIIIIKKRV